jgi:hypothetical protein
LILTTLPEGEFHLHPHYRSQTPLDATLLKVKPDSMTSSRKYADQIGRFSPSGVKV